MPLMESLVIRPEQIPARPSDVGAAPAPYACILVNGVIAYGRALAEQSSLHGTAVPVFTLDALTVDEVEVIQTTDVPSPSTASSALATIALRRVQVRKAICGKILGLSPAQISKAIALTVLQPEVLALVRSGSLPYSQARELAALPPLQQTEWARRAIAHRWSSRALRRKILGASGSPGTLAHNNAPSADIAHFERTISERLGTEVKLSWDEERHAGVLRIQWFAVDDLQGIFQQLASGPGGGSARAQKRLLEIPLIGTEEIHGLLGGME